MARQFTPPYDVGYEGSAKTGEPFTVIEYQGRKKIKIAFKCGLIKNTNSTNIRQNKVPYRHTPKSISCDSGDTFPTKEGGICVVVDFISKKEVVVEFEDGSTKTLGYGYLRAGNASIKTPRPPLPAGTRYSTNNYGYVEVVKFYSAINIQVKFEDGTTTKVTRTSLEKGIVGHPKSGVPEGYTFTNNHGFVGKVLKFHSPYNVDIVWEDGQVTYGHNANGIRKGAIYYPNAKTVAGVGYFGLGKYKPDKAGNGSNYNKRIFSSWQRMIVRCYSEAEQARPSAATYIGVKVSSDWHNFQNFCTWAEENYPDKFVEGWELDKDLFGDGKIYSPETCTLLPERLNWFLSDTYAGKIADLPEGVNYIKPATKGAKEGYIARCHVEGKRKYLGYYDNPEEAGVVYREAKEGEARRLADEYKEVLTEKQYSKLRSFKLEDIHRKSSNKPLTSLSN